MSQADDTRPAIDEQRRRWILVALMLTMALAAMDTTIVSTAIPQVVDDLGGFALFTWVFSVYLLAQTITIPIYGNLADMFGRKPVLVAGTLIFLAGSAACALAWDMVSLIVFRTLQGLGAGSIMATVNTLAGDLYAVRDRARIQGWLSSVWGMAAVAGPLLGGALAEHASWRWVFLINLPIGALSLALLARYLHETPQYQQHRIDYAGAALIMATSCVLIFALLQGGQAWAWSSPLSIGLFVAAGMLAVLAVQVERRAAEPILPAWLWRDPVLAGSNLAMLAMGVVMMGPIVYLPTFGQSVLGLGAIAAGLMLATMSIGWPIASALSGPAYLRFGFRNAGIGGVLLMIAAALGFLALSAPAPAGWVAADQMLLGAGFGLLSTPLLVGVQSCVGWARRGTVTGANMFARFLGQTLGAALFGAIFNGAMRNRLAGAPAALEAELPARVDGVIDALYGGGLSAPATHYLREAISGATTQVYIGVLVVAVLSLLAVFIIPSVFPLVEDDGPEAGGNSGEDGSSGQSG